MLPFLSLIPADATSSTTTFGIMVRTIVIIGCSCRCCCRSYPSTPCSGWTQPRVDPPLLEKLWILLFPFFFASHQGIKFIIGDRCIIIIIMISISISIVIQGIMIPYFDRQLLKLSIQCCCCTILVQSVVSGR